MGISIYKCEYSCVYRIITEKEIEFIDRYVYQSDDGCYYIEEEDGDNELSIDSVLKTAITEGNFKPEELEALVNAIRRALRESGDGLSFRLF